jgi:aspartate aminotransferase-like enzyme
MAASLISASPLLSFAAPAVPTEFELREECSAYSQAGMRDCLANHAAQSAKVLRHAEESASAALAKWDEDAKYVTAARKRLAVSGREFQRYRDAQCAFSSSLGGGSIGNALDMLRLACVAELNYQRAAQLTSAAAGLPSL